MIKCLSLHFNNNKTIICHKIGLIEWINYVSVHSNIPLDVEEVIDKLAKRPRKLDLSL